MGNPGVPKEEPHGSYDFIGIEVPYKISVLPNFILMHLAVVITVFL